MQNVSQLETQSKKLQGDKKIDGDRKRRPTHTHNKQVPDKGKNIETDEDDFQQVWYWKNTRRNTFDTLNDEQRSSAFALGDKIIAARYWAKQQENEANRAAEIQKGFRDNANGQPQIDNLPTKTTLPKEKTRVTQVPQNGNNGSSLPNDPDYTEYLTTHPINSATHHRVGETIMEPSIQKRSGEGRDDQTWGQSKEADCGSSPEGRGDPTSTTMLWSPRKHVEQNRPLEPTKSSESKDEGQDEDTKLRGQAACRQKTFEAEAHDLKQEESD